MGIRQKQLAVCFTILFFGSSMLVSGSGTTDIFYKIFMGEEIAPRNESVSITNQIIVPLLPPVDSDLINDIYKTKEKTVLLDKAA